MGLFRSYAKFQIGKKIFNWVRRRFSSGRSASGRRTRTRV